jgi:hypothetical protein
MKDESSQIKHMFITVNQGTLIITGLSIETVTSTSSDLISIGASITSVSISSSTFGNTS